MSVIQVTDLKKSYGGIRALDGCSMTFEDQAINGLIGPNGSGKTTLFNVITGYETADSGQVSLRGQDITHAKPDKVFEQGIGRTFLARLAPEIAGDLSYGQQKLLEFAFVTMAKPSVILLDEPAGGVNPSLLRHISDRIRVLNSEGVTFIIVEHDMEFVMRLCDQVLVMHQGSALTSGPPEQVRSDPAVLEAYLGTGPKEGN